MPRRAPVLPDDAPTTVFRRPDAGGTVLLFAGAAPRLTDATEVLPGMGGDRLDLGAAAPAPAHAPTRAGPPPRPAPGQPHHHAPLPAPTRVLFALTGATLAALLGLALLVAARPTAPPPSPIRTARERADRLLAHIRHLRADHPAALTPPPLAPPERSPPAP